MSDVPWWALSPSPFSIVFYLILIGYTLKKIFSYNLVILRKRDYLLAFTDAVLIVGFVVVFLDSFWIAVCLIRFGTFYPDSVLQLLFAFGRNLVAMSLCFLLIGNYFKQKILRFSNKTILLLGVNLCFLIVWFGAAPSPAFTDWTFAIRHNYPMCTAITSFFLSHIVGKSLVAIIFVSLWIKPKQFDANRTPNT